MVFFVNFTVRNLTFNITITDSKMSYLQIRNFDKHHENPFIENTVQNFSTKTKRLIVGDPTRVIMARDTGEITGQVAFINYIEVDDEKFVKMFTSEIKSLFNLSSAGIRVFGYVMNILRPNQDKIIIRTKECCKYAGYSSETPVRAGIGDLIKNGFLARTEYTEEYYINPMLFFNGNRVTFVKEYIRKNHQEEGRIGLLEEGDERLAVEEDKKRSLNTEEIKEQKRRAAVLLGKTEEELGEWLKIRKEDK
jgi:hypothetical protein